MFVCNEEWFNLFCVHHGLIWYNKHMGRQGGGCFHNNWHPHSGERFKLKCLFGLMIDSNVLWKLFDMLYFHNDIIKNTLRCNCCIYISFHFVPFHTFSFFSIPLYSFTFRIISFHFIPFHSISFNWNPIQVIIKSK